MSKKYWLLIILALAALIVYANLLLITYYNCVNYSSNIPCRIETCKFFGLGFGPVNSWQEHCCGNKQCEEGEAHFNCQEDCPPPIRTGEFSTDYAVKGGIFQFDGQIAEEKRMQMTFNFGGTADVMRIKLPIYFDHDVDNVKVDLACQDERITFFTSFLDEQGNIMINDEEGYYFHFEESDLRCLEGICMQKKPELNLEIDGAKAGSKAELELLLYVNSKKVTPVITCLVKLKSESPYQELIVPFRFIHT